jgi:protein-S-isoprenylcysteine O-methyltransferase Ste14
VFAGAPLLLGSGYGLLIGLALTVLLIARIHREEEMLARELEGYREYMRKLRYRLVPYLW